MRNLKSVEALKKFRSLNKKFYDIGTKALLYDEKACDHLAGELQLDESLNDEQLEYLFRHGSGAKGVCLDLRVLMRRSVEDIRKIIFSGLKDMEVLVFRFDASSIEKGVQLFQETDCLRSLRSVCWPLVTRRDKRAIMQEFRCYRKFERNLQLNGASASCDE